MSDPLVAPPAQAAATPPPAPVGDATMLGAVKAFLDRQGVAFTQKEEAFCTKLSMKVGINSAHVSVFNTGKIVLGGPESPFRQLLAQMKDSLENGQPGPGTPLPFEIDRFPDRILEKVPGCDPVIVAFVRESIRCFRADSLLGAAFMLGAASEKAISLLIDSYAEAMVDETNKEKFLQRSSSRTISHRFEEFKRSYAGCKSKLPADTPGGGYDLDAMVTGTFQWCRITRNEVGHPQLVPDLDKGVILANIGHFVQYIERIDNLITHFKNGGVVV